MTDLAMDPRRQRAPRGLRARCAALYKRRQDVLQKFTKFVMIGGFTTTIHFALVIVGVELLHATKSNSTLVGYACGATVSYLLNYFFGFESDELHRAAIPKFVAVISVGAAINYIIMYVLGDRLGVEYLLAQCVATGTAMFWHFGAHYVWTYRRRMPA